MRIGRALFRDLIDFDSVQFVIAQLIALTRVRGATATTLASHSCSLGSRLLLMAEVTLAFMLLNHVVNGFLRVVQIELVILSLLLLLALFVLVDIT